MGISYNVLNLKTNVLIEPTTGSVANVCKTNEYFGSTSLKYVRENRTEEISRDPVPFPRHVNLHTGAVPVIKPDHALDMVPVHVADTADYPSVLNLCAGTKPCSQTFLVQRGYHSRPPDRWL